MSAKLVLGTVQFGCQYGINSCGRPDMDMVRSILVSAGMGGIDTLDTSSAYGDAETVLGQTLPEDSSFKIVSKYPKGGPTVAQMFDGSLNRLGVTALYGYLLHHFELYRADKAIWNEFRALKDKGLVQKTGFSLYTPDELQMLLDDKVQFDLIQIPRNIFDRKFDPYLEELKARGVEIHVRSTFLQGLFFKDRDSLPEKMQPLAKYLRQLDCYSAESGLDISKLALGFNLHNPCIDGVLIGVDNVAQLEANLVSASARKTDIDIKVTEQELLNPVNWK